MSILGYSEFHKRSLLKNVQNSKKSINAFLECLIIINSRPSKKKGETNSIKMTKILSETPHKMHWDIALQIDPSRRIICKVIPILDSFSQIIRKLFGDCFLQWSSQNKELVNSTKATDK